MLNHDMNFFAPYEGKKKEQKNKNIYIYSLIVFMVVAIIGSFIYNTASILIAKNKISFYEKELEKPEILEKVKVYEELDRKNTALLSYEGQVKEITEAIESRQVVDTEILNKVSGTLPSEVSISGIIINKDQINIKAVSTDRIAIGEFEHNLRNLDITKDIYISSISGSEIYTFDVKCYLKEVN